MTIDPSDTGSTGHEPRASQGATTSEPSQSEAHGASSSIEGTRFIVFRLGGEKFALPLLTVREVIAPPDITPVPFSPAYFLGIINLRGQVISVIDLRLKLQMKTEKSSENAIIIIDLGVTQIGMWVDSVDFVLTPAANQVHEPPSGPVSAQTKLAIERVFRHGDGLILCVDPLGILNPEDRAFLNHPSNPAPGKVA